METIEVVVTALEAGLVAGMKDSATAAVKDGYASLVAGVHKILSREVPNVDANVVEDPAKRDQLVAALTTARVDVDTALVEQARQLLATIRAEESQSGKFAVRMRNPKGFQVGDGNTQTNNF